MSHSISIINYETLETEREIILNNNIYPHHFCVDKEENKIFIPSLINGTLYAVDIISGKILNSIIYEQYNLKKGEESNEG